MSSRDPTLGAGLSRAHLPSSRLLQSNDVRGDLARVGRLQRVAAGGGDGSASTAGAEGGQMGAAFEALLVRQLVRAMRATVPSAEGATGSQMYDELIEQGLSEHLSSGRGLGLAELFDGSRTPGSPVARLTTRSSLAATLVADSEGGAAVPLAARLPPQEDAWLLGPDAEAQLRAALAGTKPSPTPPDS